MRLDASTALPVSANRRRLYECCPPAPTFTAGNEKTQVIESTHVINRELWVALQFPIGDDVSAYTRSKAANFFDNGCHTSLRNFASAPILEALANRFPVFPVSVRLKETNHEVSR